MQDIFAVIYLTVSEGKYPSIWAFLVLALLIPHVRKALYKLIDYAGHGELLVVSGLFFALGAGYEFFYSVSIFFIVSRVSPTFDRRSWLNKHMQLPI